MWVHLHVLMTGGRMLLGFQCISSPCTYDRGQNVMRVPMYIISMYLRQGAEWGCHWSEYRTQSHWRFESLVQQWRHHHLFVLDPAVVHASQNNESVPSWLRGSPAAHTHTHTCRQLYFSHSPLSCQTCPGGWGGGRREGGTDGETVGPLPKPGEDSGLHLDQQASDLDSMTKEIQNQTASRPAGFGSRQHD